MDDRGVLGYVVALLLEERHAPPPSRGLWTVPDAPPPSRRWGDTEAMRQERREALDRDWRDAAA